jgi:hypothetical protein
LNEDIGFPEVEQMKVNLAKSYTIDYMGFDRGACEQTSVNYVTYDAKDSVSSRLICTSFEAGTMLCHHVSSMISTGLGQLELNRNLNSLEAH